MVTRERFDSSSLFPSITRTTGKDNAGPCQPSALSGTGRLPAGLHDDGHPVQRNVMDFQFSMGCSTDSCRWPLYCAVKHERVHSELNS